MPSIIRPRRSFFCAMGLALALSIPSVQAQARFVQTPYKNPKALFDIYLDHPAKLGAAPRCTGCAPS